MKTQIIPEVGDILVLKAFSFNNKLGGIGMSNWEHDEKFTKPINVKVTKTWNDYECGQRGWALPDQREKEFISYLQRNAKEGSHNVANLNNPLEWKEEKGLYIIYWSEFDIISIY